jgi:hypothetical protein
MNRTSQKESQTETETIGKEIAEFMKQIKETENDQKEDAKVEMAKLKA